MMKISTRSRIPRSSAVLLSVALLGAAPCLSARQGETFTAEEQITAIDLVVEVEAGGLRNWASGGSLRDFKAQEFEIFYDGEPRPVVGLGDPSAPWTLVIYFDYALSGRAGVRRAASALAEQADALARLGRVEVVVADPIAGEVLSPTRDAERIGAVLSEIALFPEGRDELVTLRRAFLDEIRNDSAMNQAELAQALVEEEVRIVRRQLDALLLELVDGVDADARRALLLVSGGFDPEPADFYRPYLAAGAAEQAPAASLRAEVGELGHTLAAYGWITFALMPPEPEPMPPGRRLGKWRILGLGAVYEEHRDPEKAESYLELGRTLVQQGKPEAAAEAFRKAVYHFYDNPKTADRQAEALVHLAAALEDQGKSQAAQEALEEAVRIDPSRAAILGPGGSLRDPSGPLRSFAQSTVGMLVRDREALAAAVASLSRRVHLIYQVAGLPDGRLHALEVRLRRGGTAVRAPGWSRSSIPEAVAKARLRRLLEGELPGGELRVRGNLRPAPGSPAGEMTARIGVSLPDPLVQDGATARLRITLGLGDPSSALTLRHETLEPQKLAAGEEWIYSTRIALPEAQPWVAVLVEDLNSGRWGTGLLESFDLSERQSSISRLPRGAVRLQQAVFIFPVRPGCRDVNSGEGSRGGGMDVNTPDKPHTLAWYAVVAPLPYHGCRQIMRHACKCDCQNLFSLMCRYHYIAQVIEAIVECDQGMRAASDLDAYRKNGQGPHRGEAIGRTRTIILCPGSVRNKSEQKENCCNDQGHFRCHVSSS